MSTLTKDVLVELIRDKVGYPVKEATNEIEIILREKLGVEKPIIR